MRVARSLRPLWQLLALVAYSLLLVSLAQPGRRTTSWRDVPSYTSCASSAAGGAAWREAEYAAQAALRKVADLQQRVRAKSPLATEKKRAAYASSAGRDELKALLRRAERDVAQLQSRANALRSSGPATPLLTRLPRSRVRAVNVSFVLQYYNKPLNVLPIAQRLYGCTRGRLGAGGSLLPGLTSELVAHVDSRGDAAAWEEALSATAEGSFVTVILSDNLHEVHGALVLLVATLAVTNRTTGYNRGAALARGDVLVMLQDDDVPPEDCSWLTEHLASFARWPRLAAVSHRGGYFWFPEEMGDKEHMRAPDVAGPLFSDPASGRPFEFMSTLAYGPVAFRADAYRDVGGMDEALTPERGDCGMYADAEFALRLWANGWQVAHSAPVFHRGPHDGGSSHVGNARVLCYTKQARPHCRAPPPHVLFSPRNGRLPQTHLNYHATVRRFPMGFTRGVLRSVAALNSNLTRRFEGPAPWEHPARSGGLGLDADSLSAAR